MFGFRVYELKVTRGPRATTALPVENPLGTGASYVDRLDDALAELAGRGVVSDIPHLERLREWEPPLEPDKGTPRLQVESFEPWRSGHRLIKFLHGFHGQFDEAIGPSRMDLRGHAATGNYRALLLLPKTGTAARLVVETIDRHCPVTMLMHWLTRIDSELNPEAYTRARFKQMADRARVRAMARDTERITARLTEKAPGGAGNSPGRKAVLTQTITAGERKERLIDEMIGWLDREVDGSYVQRIEEIAGYDPADLDRIGLKFNHGAVEIVDSNGQPKTINPESIRERFTYKVSDNLQADDHTWLQKVASQLVGTMTEGTDIIL